MLDEIEPPLAMGVQGGRKEHIMCRSWITLGVVVASTGLAMGQLGKAKDLAREVVEKASGKTAGQQQAEKKQKKEAGDKEPNRRGGEVIKPDPDNRKLDWRKYPMTDGSTSAEPLGVTVACEWTGTPRQWQRRFKDRRLLPIITNTSVVDGDFPLAHLYGRIRHHGTHGAYSRLIGARLAESGQAVMVEGPRPQLIYECRLPSEDEKEAAEATGVKLKPAAIARDAFVFLVRDDNPVKNLTLAQVRDIFSGKVTNWSRVGGPDREINAYTRNRNSGSQETMESLVMKGKATIQGRQMITMSMIGPYNRLGQDPAGIGYTFFYYQRNMSPGKRGRARAGKARPESPGIRMLSIDGVAPGKKTIADGTYPLVTEVYCVTRADLPADSTAARLRDWLTTPAGQAVVAASGYVPLAQD
jgi:phosphate transport system substrate-binding protein